MSYIYHKEIDIAMLDSAMGKTESWCQEHISEYANGDFIHERSGRPVEWDLAEGLIWYLRQPTLDNEHIYHIGYLAGVDWLVATCHLSYTHNDLISFTSFLMVEFPDEATAVAYRLTCEL